MNNLSIPELKLITALVRDGNNHDIQRKIDEPNKGICVDCDIKLGYYLNEFTLSCPSCKKTICITSNGESNITKYELSNISSTGSVAFRPQIGGSFKNSYRSSIYTETAEYKRVRDSTILAKLVKANYINSQFKIPYVAIKSAANMYITIKDTISLRNETYTRRGMNLNGVLGACLKVQCTEHKCSKTKSQIAIMMCVDESKISFGLLELKRLKKMGVIDVKFNADPTPDYIDAYFEDFEIDDKYKPFILELVARINSKKIKSVASKLTTTICIGCIYLLSMLVNDPISHADIRKYCESITKTTYMCVVNAIIANKKALRKPFVRNNIPVPLEWL